MSGIVHFEAVGLRHGTGVELLAGVDLALARGDYGVVAGEAGTGKTSLLDLATLALRLGRGRVRLFGHDTAALPRHARPAIRRRIGIVAQEPVLIAGLSVAANIGLPLALAGVARAEIDARVAELLDWADLRRRASAPPWALTADERRHVAIARAIVGDPELLVADEPTAALDHAAERRVLHLLERLNRRGTTILLATRDPDLAARAGASMPLRLADGRLTKAVAMRAAAE